MTAKVGRVAVVVAGGLRWIADRVAPAVEVTEPAVAAGKQSLTTSADVLAWACDAVSVASVYERYADANTAVESLLGRLDDAAVREVAVGLALLPRREFLGGLRRGPVTAEEAQYVRALMGYSWSA